MSLYFHQMILRVKMLEYFSPYGIILGCHAMPIVPLYKGLLLLVGDELFLLFKFLVSFEKCVLILYGVSGIVRIMHLAVDENKSNIRHIFQGRL